MFEDFNGMNGVPTTTTTSTDTMNTNSKFIQDAQMMFDPAMMMDGNDNMLNFETQTGANMPTHKLEEDLKNENLMIDDHQQTMLNPEKDEEGLIKQYEEDFGPETDVDAVDEAMTLSSPQSVSQEDDHLLLEGGQLPKEFQQFEAKEIDAAEKVAFDSNNPFGDYSPDQVVDQDVIEISGDSHEEFYEQQQITTIHTEVGDSNGVDFDLGKEHDMMDIVQQEHDDMAVRYKDDGNELSAEERQYEEFLRQTSGQLVQDQFAEEKGVFGLPKEVIGGPDQMDEDDIPVERPFDASDEQNFMVNICGKNINFN